MSVITIYDVINNLMIYTQKKIEIDRKHFYWPDNSMLSENLWHSVLKCLIRVKFDFCYLLQKEKKIGRRAKIVKKLEKNERKSF